MAEGFKTDRMRWAQLIAALLIAILLMFAWVRYSVESDPRRRAAELCLWITPVAPFLIAALHLAISHSTASLGSVVPTGIKIVVPAIVLHLVLLVVALRTLSMPMRLF